MNKRGDIPITIFVLGVVAICVLVIVSFYISENKTKNSFEVLSVIEKLNSIEEEIRFYEQTGKEPLEIMKIFKKELFLKSKFIYKGEKNAGYSLEGSLMDGEKRILFIKYRIVD